MFKRRRSRRLGSNMRQCGGRFFEVKFEKYIRTRNAHIAITILRKKSKHLLKLSHQPTQFLFKIIILNFMSQRITLEERDIATMSMLNAQMN